jgi:hypothetical protein
LSRCAISSTSSGTDSEGGFVHDRHAGICDSGCSLPPPRRISRAWTWSSGLVRPTLHRDRSPHLFQLWRGVRGARARYAGENTIYVLIEHMAGNKENSTIIRIQSTVFLDFPDSMTAGSGATVIEIRDLCRITFRSIRESARLRLQTKRQPDIHARV